MANDTTGNPWKIDSTGVLTTSIVHVNRMKWTPVTSGDDILVVDNGSSETWSLKAIAGDTDQQIEYWLEIDNQVNGVNVSTIDSGTLYIYIR